MSTYNEGSIVWYFKESGDPDLLYDGDDPIAATVTTVHSDSVADLTIMFANDRPIIRSRVALVETEAERPFARVERA